MNKILVIDNDELFLALLLEILNRKGWQAIGTNNGQLGLKLAKEVIPDLILCELKMAGFNGYEVLKALRQDTLTQKMPLIFFSTPLTEHECIRAQELGANDCLNKFFTLEKLFHTIQTHMELNNSDSSVELALKNHEKVNSTY